MTREEADRLVERDRLRTRDLTGTVVGTTANRVSIQWDGRTAPETYMVDDMLHISKVRKRKMNMGRTLPPFVAGMKGVRCRRTGFSTQRPYGDLFLRDRASTPRRQPLLLTLYQPPGRSRRHDPVRATSPPNRRSRRQYSAIAVSSVARLKSGQ
jgi:hypothetical protein